MSVNQKQIGGDHYREGGELQHWDFIAINGLSYLVGCATKYIARHRKKGGRQDLEKALHYIEKLQALHLVGAVERTQHKRMLEIPVGDFCEANGITGEEREAIQALTYWTSTSDLHHAWEIVDGLRKHYPA